MAWLRPKCCCGERVERIECDIRQIDQSLRAQRMLLYDILADVRVIVGSLRPRLVRIRIGDLPMSLEVGKTTVATVTGIDQFGQPFPIDFNATPASWSETGGLATIAADPASGSEDVTGTAAGTGEVLSVNVAGLTASVSFDVANPAPVLSSISISLNPPV